MKKILSCAMIFFVAAGAARADTTSAARADFMVTFSQAEEAVGLALTEKGAGDKVTATIGGNKTRPMFQHGAPVTVEASGVKFDKASGRWNGNILFISEGKVITAVPASGSFNEMTELPVFKREIRSGSLIEAGDIEIRDYPLGRTRSDVVNDIASLVGMTPLRTISPFRPIRVHEIAAPAVVKKNSLVQMRYNAPGIEITTAGQALTGGAKGDVIEVRNAASKKIVRAVIFDPHTVDIVSAHPQAAQLTGADHAAN